ncbi:flavin reductase family protein [Streptomyces mangrovisoli]|uniref:Flavin reductase n=1 Tax=Streptomyces mangrovisoli TaxID=1428628 RepID=A0A1J4P1N2_9ACTN|nr:flavin reductase family protein [Streptomyces mangrovisoli]OIJ68130.1 flavin reductase [Streptomyces mangrovisoli]
MRVDHSPESMDPGSFYRLLTSVIVPRPIAWVSTLSADGRTANLAPHSFFTVASTDPPIVQFTSVGRKDSLRNVEATREFVVNFAPEPLLEQINATATDFPRSEGEFDAVGVEREPSSRVAPPRVAASPVALECTLHATLGLGDSTVVFGRVVHAVVSADVLADGRPDIRLLRPLSRLGGNEWGTIGQVHDLARIRYRDLPAGQGPDDGDRRG